jgi:hypothetical protein
MSGAALVHAMTMAMQVVAILLTNVMAASARPPRIQDLYEKTWWFNVFKENACLIHQFNQPTYPTNRASIASAIWLMMRLAAPI